MHIYLPGVFVFIVALTVFFTVKLYRKYDKPSREEYTTAVGATLILSLAWPVTLVVLAFGAFMISITIFVDSYLDL